MIGQIRPDLAAVLQGKGLSEEQHAVTLLGRWNRRVSIDICWFRQNSSAKAKTDGVWVVLSSRTNGLIYDELRLLWRDQKLIDLYRVDYRESSICPQIKRDSLSYLRPDDAFRNLVIQELQSSVPKRQDGAYGRMANCRWTAFDFHRELRIVTGAVLTALACAALHRFGKKRLTRQRLRIALGATGVVGLGYMIWQGKRTDENGPYVSYHRNRMLPYTFDPVENTTPADDDVSMWMQCLFTERQHA